MLVRSLLAILVIISSSFIHAESLTDQVFGQKAGNLNYKYISAGVIDVDDFGSGFNISGSYDLEENIAVSGYFYTASKGPFEISILGVDGLIHRYYTEDTDIFYGVGFRRQKVKIESFNFFGFDSGGGSASETGLVFTLGGRVQVNDELEINGKVALETVDDTDIEFSIGGLYSLTDELSADGGMQFSDADIMRLGLRYNFN